MDLLSEDNKDKTDSKTSIQENAPHAPNGSDNKKESESTRVMKEIEEERKKKGVILDNIRRFRRRLAYKLAEKDAIAKLTTINRKSTKNIGYLRRKKEALEFRISTEAFTLEAEKDLIRKKNEVDEELQEAINSYRMKRKAEFVNSDIEEMNKKIEESNLALMEIEKKLDVLYSGLRRQRAPPKPRSRPEHKTEEVSFADIAVIKDKKEEKKNSGD